MGVDPQPAQEGQKDDPARWDFEEGAEIVPGRYALKKLGGGTDYEAYLAWDDDLMTLVVAKCVRPHLVKDEDALRRLRRESGYLLELRHPVLVRGLDSVLDGERPHLVMEHLEGPNLASLIRRYGPVALEQLLPLALQLCSAVHYLGARKVVHLDIKPRNIIMGAPPRLIDLSVARTVADALHIHNPIGTDAYMAPEQCDLTRPRPGPPADVWGLGASLYHALAGEVPFPRPGFDSERDKGDRAVRFPQLEQEPRPLDEGLPGEVRGIVMRCLEKEPEARPSPRDIVASLQPLVAAFPARPVLGRVRPGRRLLKKKNG